MANGRGMYKNKFRKKRHTHRTDEDTRFETVLQEPTCAYNSDTVVNFRNSSSFKKKRPIKSSTFFSARINSILTTGGLLFIIKKEIILFHLNWTVPRYVQHTISHFPTLDVCCCCFSVKRQKNEIWNIFKNRNWLIGGRDRLWRVFFCVGFVLKKKTTNNSSLSYLHNSTVVWSSKNIENGLWFSIWKYFKKKKCDQCIEGCIRFQVL